MVVVRVHSLSTESNVERSEESGIKFRAIPWDSNSDGVLTINVALWALAMMALNDHSRDYGQMNEYKSLAGLTRVHGYPSMVTHPLSRRVMEEATLRAGLGDQQLTILETNEVVPLRRMPSRTCKAGRIPKQTEDII